MKRPTEALAAAEPLPYADIVMRAGDTRPIHMAATIGEGGSFSFAVSAGSAEDIAELQVFLEMALATCQVVGHNRVMAEEARKLDELPF